MARNKYVQLNKGEFMKKNAKLATIISLLSVFVISGCGVINPVSQKMIDDINTIGEVTLEDEKLINKLQERYNTLTPSQKKQVNNYKTLVDAEDELEMIKEDALASFQDSIGGNWKQTGTLELVYFIANIEDDKIRIYSTSLDGQVWTLYWSGSYEKPKEVMSEYCWESENCFAETQYALRGSQDETKKITYKNGKLLFSGQFDGVYFDAVMEKTPEQVAKCDEKLIEGSTLEYKFCNDVFNIPKMYRKRSEKINEATFFAPNAILYFNCLDFDGTSLSDIEVDIVLNYITKELASSDNELEVIRNESITIKNHPAKVYEMRSNYSDVKGNAIAVVYYNESVKKFVMVECVISTEADYDYASEFEEMIYSMN